MCRYSHQISFTSSAWQSLVQNSADPLASIRTPIQSLGGNLVNAFFTGDCCFDLLALTEFPNSVSADDISIAFYAGGAIATIHTAVLLNVTEAHEAKAKSGSHSFRLFRRSRALAASV
jgi:uncharacterized protein with GYD domain